MWTINLFTGDIIEKCLLSTFMRVVLSVGEIQLGNSLLRLDWEKVMILQRKALYRHQISDSRRARKEIVDIDILVTFRNGDRKIMQSIRITSRTPSRVMERNQLSQF